MKQLHSIRKDRDDLRLKLDRQFVEQGVWDSPAYRIKPELRHRLAQIGLIARFELLLHFKIS